MFYCIYVFWNYVSLSTYFWRKIDVFEFEFEFEPTASAAAASKTLVMRPLLSPEPKKGYIFHDQISWEAERMGSKV